MLPPTHLQAVLEKLLCLAVGIAKQLDDHNMVLVVLRNLLCVCVCVCVCSKRKATVREHDQRTGMNAACKR